MTTRPINLRAWEVRAFLEGRKTRITRVLKPQPKFGFTVWQDEWHGAWMQSGYGESGDDFLAVPFSPGDLLWAREALGRRIASFLGIEATNGVEEAFYLADDEDAVNKNGFNLCPTWPRFMGS